LQIAPLLSWNVSFSIKVNFFFLYIFLAFFISYFEKHCRFFILWNNQNFVHFARFVIALALGSRPRQRCGKVQTGSATKSHICIPKNVGECEGMNPHTRKWTPILGVGVHMDSRIFKKYFEVSKFIGFNNSLYHWKSLWCLKWGRIIHLNTYDTNYGQMKG
jgi:hypothetical protein